MFGIKLIKKIKNKNKDKNPKSMKKLSPQAKAKILAGLKKGAGLIVNKKTGAVTKPTPKQKAVIKKAVEKTPTTTQPASNFWNDKIDMGFIKPTGKQLLIGSAVTVGVGAVAYKMIRH